MPIPKSALFGIAFSTLLATPGLAATVDFESFASGDIITAGTDLGGLSFGQDILVTDDAASVGPGQTGNVALGQGSGANLLTGSFASTVNSFFLSAGDNAPDFDLIALTGFDGTGAIVSSFITVTSSATLIGIVGTGIASFEIAFLDDTLAPGSAGIDNLSFTFESGPLPDPEDPIAPVPLPASLPLALAGLGALGWMKRRRKAA